MVKTLHFYALITWTEFKTRSQVPGSSFKLGHNFFYVCDRARGCARSDL
jgi:hypothetical protein